MDAGARHVSGVTLITPTGDRREAFRLCEHWMKRQTYRGPRQWIVVDDGHAPIKTSQGQTYIRRQPRANDPRHTLCANMRLALPHVEYDRVLIIEDDDYYPPSYIERMLQWMDGADLVGEVGATYYFVKTSQYRIFTEHIHASFCRSGFTRAVLPLVRQLAASDDWRLDLRLWEAWTGTKYLYRSDRHDMSISMKGMPGRVGVTHKPAASWILHDDSNLERLRAWIGEDYRYYLPYVKRPATIEKLLVYTVCFGGYDQIQAQPAFPGAVEYVAITDLDAPPPWRVHRMPQLYSSPRRSSRQPKILAHEYFPGRTTLYIDANFRFLADPRRLAAKLIQQRPEAQLYLFRHPDRDDVRQEADVVMRYGFDDAETVKKHIARYKGMDTARIGLGAGGCILRRPGCERFNEVWWEEYQSGSMRDQISLPYALATSGVTYFLSAEKCPQRPGDRNEWIECHGHNMQRMTMEARRPQTLAELYRVAAATRSDINEHLPKLRELSSQCRHVTEFGVRRGVSTTALLAGQPGRMISYDIDDAPVAATLATVAGKTRFEFRKSDVLTMTPIEPTDLLFVDTRHTEAQLWAELNCHGRQVRRFIALHDSHTFGERGEDGGRGIMYAVRRWLREHPEWRIVYRAARNNGLVVMERASEAPCQPAAETAMAGDATR
jgi:hypothetical protein